MGYLNAIQSAIGNLGKLGQLGAPPSPKPTPQVGTPPAPPPNPNAAPHPYDAANDPAWKGILDAADHAFRNFLNGLDPDHREMLRQKLSKPPTPAPVPTATPTLNPMQRLLSPGFGAAQPPASTSRVPGTF